MATEQVGDVWGLTVGHWHAVTGIGTVALTIATGVLAWVAWYQIGAAREEAKKTRTLEMVGKYDHDPALDRSLRRMGRARDRGDLLEKPRDYRFDIIAVMNYFETMAIGILQGMYIEPMVRDFMEPIVKYHVDEVMGAKIFDKIGLDPDDFEHILTLNAKWQKRSAVHYKGGRK